MREHWGGGEGEGDGEGEGKGEEEGRGRGTGMPAGHSVARAPLSPRALSSPHPQFPGGELCLYHHGRSGAAFTSTPFPCPKRQATPLPAASVMRETPEQWSLARLGLLPSVSQGTQDLGQPLA